MADATVTPPSGGKTAEEIAAEQTAAETKAAEDAALTPDQREIRKLKDENAQRRIKNTALEKAISEKEAIDKKAADQKLIDDGKLQEVIDSQGTELSSLKEVKEKNDTYEKYFSDQLEAQLKTLSETHVALINESNMTTSEKLKWAIKLSETGSVDANSPDSTRPGGQVVNPDINLEDYQGNSGRKALIQLKNTNPKKYEMVLKLKQNQE